MLAWLKRHLGVQINDYSLSVWWQWEPTLSPSELTRGADAFEHILAQRTRMFGFTLGPWFATIDRNNDIAHMLCLKDMRWLSNYTFSWGVGRCAGGGYMDEWDDPIETEQSRLKVSFAHDWDDEEPTLIRAPLGK